MAFNIGGFGGRAQPPNLNATKLNCQEKIGVTGYLPDASTPPPLAPTFYLDPEKNYLQKVKRCGLS